MADFHAAQQQLVGVCIIGEGPPRGHRLDVDAPAVAVVERPFRLQVRGARSQQREVGAQDPHRPSDNGFAFLHLLGHRVGELIIYRLFHHRYRTDDGLLDVDGVWLLLHEDGVGFFLFPREDGGGTTAQRSEVFL